MVAFALIAALPIGAVGGGAAAIGRNAAYQTKTAGAVQRTETFELVWSTVNEAYFDESFGGVDWHAVGDRFRAKLETVASNDELRALLQAMLGELGRSHFGILPRELAVFQAHERDRVGTTGLEVDYIDGRVVVARIKPGSAGDRAGLKAGTTITAINGQALEPILLAMRQASVDERQVGIHLCHLVTWSLQATVGATLAISGEDTAGQPLAASLATEAHDGTWADPIGSFPSMPLECETRAIGDGLAFMRFNSFAPGLMKRLREYIRSLAAQGGLVIDLRGNPGGVTGMVAGIAGMLVEREVSFGTMQLRKGAMRFVAYPQDGAFLGPVAVLIDGHSASSSEILAAGLRDIGRARLFGERTAGAALPSAFRRLPNGDLLQYAIGDVRTLKGSAIEGIGVEPDVRVERKHQQIIAGQDPVLEAARAWLEQTVGQEAHPVGREE